MSSKSIIITKNGSFVLSSLYHDGALRMKPVKQPAATPAMGIVAIHLNESARSLREGRNRKTYPAKILTICSQLTALNPPDMTPTPAVAPTIHMVVDTGIPNWEARMTVMEAPNSIEKPRDGEWRVILLPREIIML